MKKIIKNDAICLAIINDEVIWDHWKSSKNSKLEHQTLIWSQAARDENSSVLTAFGPNPSMHAHNLHGDDFKWIFETLFRQIDMLEETTLDRPRSYQIN